MNFQNELTEIFKVLNKLELDVTGNEVAEERLQTLRQQLYSLRLMSVHGLAESDINNMAEYFEDEDNRGNKVYNGTYNNRNA